MSAARKEWQVTEYLWADVYKRQLESCQSYKKEEIPVIALLDGENACPPEDCNGIWGYRKMLKALEKPRSKACLLYTSSSLTKLISIFALTF